MLFYFFSSFSVKSYSEVVDKVEIEGNERISLETIIVFGDIAIGKDYEASDINLLIKKLYETTFFSNISVELENNILNIFIKEKSNYTINNLRWRKSTKVQR